MSVILSSKVIQLLQVLLSEEVDGSLRRIKGTAMLAKHRFASLQRRGLIEPRVSQQRSQVKKRRVSHA